jgi:hypothetical protein
MGRIWDGSRMNMGRKSVKMREDGMNMGGIWGENGMKLGRKEDKYRAKMEESRVKTEEPRATMETSQRNWGNM